MHVRHVPYAPTRAALDAGRPALIPELLAATGARYSRNNEGLDAILAKIDFGNEAEIDARLTSLLQEQSTNPDPGFLPTTLQLLTERRAPDVDRSVDSIFRMVDYGHASIADMSVVPIFMDGVSLFLAYYLWSISPQAAGQESSTRYIQMNSDGLPPPQDLGILPKDAEHWTSAMRLYFAAYEEALGIWTTLAEERPDLTRIPRSLLDDPSDRARKQVARMQRNFAFDRARPFLPLAARTNVMMVMSARAWVDVISTLLSCPWTEGQALGEMLRGELALATPRLIKHARHNDDTAAVLAHEFARWQAMAAHSESIAHEPGTRMSAMPEVFLRIVTPVGTTNAELAAALRHRTNRYSKCGSAITSTMVTYGGKAIGIAELRDMNRHRPGTKDAPLVPVGFHCALDQIPADRTDLAGRLLTLESEVGRLAYHTVRERLLAGKPDYIYFAALGTQVPFQHHNTANHFIYEAELRTGIGTHYRYARHYSEMLDLWYNEVPETRDLILEGTAEPE